MERSTHGPDEDGAFRDGRAQAGADGAVESVRVEVGAGDGGLVADPIMVVSGVRLLSVRPLQRMLCLVRRGRTEPREEHGEQEQGGDAAHGVSNVRTRPEVPTRDHRLCHKVTVTLGWPGSPASWTKRGEGLVRRFW